MLGGQSPASVGLAMSERGLRQLVINFMHIINLSAFWRVGQIAHKVPLLSLAHGWVVRQRLALVADLCQAVGDLKNLVSRRRHP